MTDRPPLNPPQHKDKFIAIDCDGDIRIHFMDTTGNYATLCGLDGDDINPAVNQCLVKLPSKPLVNCLECIAIFVRTHEYSSYDINWSEWNERHE